MTTKTKPSESSLSEKFTARISGISGLAGLVAAISGIYDFLQSGKYSALIWASAFVLVVLISLAALAWRREIGRFFERVSGSDQPKQLLYSALAVAVIIVAILWAGLIALGVVGRTWAGRAESPPKVFGVISPQVPPGLPWSDSFDGKQLDPNKWRPSPLPNSIFVKDGLLRFDVNLSSTDKPINRAELKPIPPGWPIGQVDATVTAQQTSGLLRGGVILFVRQESGTVTGVGFGPSKEGPGIEPWICRKDTCAADYGDFSHPEDKGVRFMPDQDVAVHIVQTGKRVEVQAGGSSFSANDDPSPIVDVRFRFDADPGDHWVAAVDDLKLTPATR